MTQRWMMELLERIIPSNLQTVRSYTKKHIEDDPIDNPKWANIVALKKNLAKTSTEESVFDKLKKAISTDDKPLVSKLQIEMNRKMDDLKHLYKDYTDNQI